MEEHVVFDDGVSRESLVEGKVGDGEHSISTLCDLKLSHGLATISIIPERVVKVGRIKIVISSNTVVPDKLHVFQVCFSQLGVISFAVPGEPFDGSNVSKESKDGNCGNRVDSIQYRWGTLGRKKGRGFFVSRLVENSFFERQGTT